MELQELWEPSQNIVTIICVCIIHYGSSGQYASSDSQSISDLEPLLLSFTQDNVSKILRKIIYLKVQAVSQVPWFLNLCTRNFHQILQCHNSWSTQGTFLPRAVCSCCLIYLYFPSLISTLLPFSHPSWFSSNLHFSISESPNLKL